MKKQQKENQEIARIIEREQVISYKRKPTTKPNKESDDDIESANSLKSHVFSEDSVRFSKKNTPLPELGRDKKKIFGRGIGQAGSQQINNYLDKEVRQHDNLVLKQKNNHLSSENMKLKTRVMALEKQNFRLVKLLEDQSLKIKQPGLLPKDHKLKGSENISLKMTIKNLRKQLDEQKKQNQKIKWSIKFTRINELQYERDAILTETSRLRQLLQEEQIKKISHKHKEQGMSHLEHKVHALGEKNLLLMRQNAELQSKMKNLDEIPKKNKQSSQNQKNLSRMLFNAKKTIKEKQKEIEQLKQHSLTQAEIKSANSIKFGGPKSVKQVGEKNKAKDKRVVSKSAQKYRKNPSEQDADCTNCEKYKQQIGVLEKKIQDLSLSLKKEKQSNGLKGLGDFRREQLVPATEAQSEQVGRFLTFRFKAHHLSLEEAERYLINSEINQKTLEEQISVMEIAQSLVAQPFSIISNIYLEVTLMNLFYYEQCKTNDKILIEESKKFKKSIILENFRKMVKPFEIMPQQKEEQMFIQIAELVTNYHQHILTALNRNKNGEGTISEKQICNFFHEIELEQQFIDFIICQIILESLDLEHLNYYTMFEIFYMPNQVANEPVGVSGPDQPNKKKFQVDHSQIVKQEDQEYEESRSYVQAKQKTQSRRDDDEIDLQDPHNQSITPKHQKTENAVIEERENYDEELNEDINQQKNESKVKEKKNQEDEEYEEYFEEQKMDEIPEKSGGQQAQQQMKPYMMEQIMDDYQENQHE